jgi:hypothetical protein
MNFSVVSAVHLVEGNPWCDSPFVVLCRWSPGVIPRVVPGKSPLTGVPWSDPMDEVPWWGCRSGCLMVGQPVRGPLVRYPWRGYPGGGPLVGSPVSVSRVGSYGSGYLEEVPWTGAPHEEVHWRVCCGARPMKVATGSVLWRGSHEVGHGGVLWSGPMERVPWRVPCRCSPGWSHL